MFPVWYSRQGERTKMALASSSVKVFAAPKSWPSSSIERVFLGSPRPSSLFLPRHAPATSILSFSRRPHQNSAISSSKKKKKSSSFEDIKQEEDDMDDDAFEALFSMLEEDLKKDGSSIDDDDGDDISEADFDKLQRALEEALGIADDDDVEILSSTGDDVEGANAIEEEDDDEEEEERPVKLKNWQLRRLARALKNGRRKTSIKSLAAELCLDRAIVLELLRDPPPNLVMMSAALPDEPASTSSLPESKPIEIIPAESVSVDDVKSKSEKGVPVHVLRHRWSAQKRLKKVHVETLERVYKRTRRPTNAMISSIVQVTNLPRKRVVKWFEDKRNEDGIPEHRVPYQRNSKPMEAP
ncbi:protein OVEREXPRESSOR OF CATIONIC PEROXIDASE 3 [Hevea brasiliensis]|uniref:protein OVEREXPRESSOR OF CATIONIC PEROXIDASE 3 n=1 Tax=Hevea brasiliensis TaxID=3981 RepID=UPI0025CC831D|nr:protein OVEREXPRESSOR OF CATIONIC PEROXIDASE 3 [Hevea brasiliensis]